MQLISIVMNLPFEFNRFRFSLLMESHCVQLIRIIVPRMQHITECVESDEGAILILCCCSLLLFTEYKDKVGLLVENTLLFLVITA